MSEPENDGPSPAAATPSAWARAIAAAEATHRPVMRSEVVAALDPGRGGVFLDGTFGLGGYARALLDSGADRVIGVDRDPEALRRAAAWAPAYAGRLTLIEAPFSQIERHGARAPEAAPENAPELALEIAPEIGTGRLAGVALDLGVSSLQLDEAARGFSFVRDGPLDMRMGDDAAQSAADLVNGADEASLADILYLYGEERASRRIARRIAQARAEAPIETTARLAEIVAGALPRPKPGQPHPATRSFQALRIAVNRELDELVDGLAAMERLLGPGGVLAVVTFHSLEDRIVKRFLAARAGRAGGPSRHAPPQPSVNPEAGGSTPSFAMRSARPVSPSDAEIAENPRARSAKLRAATRTSAPPWPPDRDALGAPRLGSTTRRGAAEAEKRRRR